MGELKIKTGNEKNLKTAKKWAKIGGKLLGVRAIFLSGSLARGDAGKDSDIDFFIITKNEQLWTARFFIFLVLIFSGMMKRKNKHTGKICPNHFISEKWLEIQEKDKYSAELFSRNIPLFDPQNIFAEFVQKNENWIESFNYSFREKSTGKNHNIISEPNFFEKILENFLAQIQIWKIKNSPESKLPNHKILWNKKELRFHPYPKNKFKI